MVRITNYDRELVFFECECGYAATSGISERITTDCVFKVDIECTKCGSIGGVYYLHNTDESIAKELLAEFESLKLK